MSAEARRPDRAADPLAELDGTRRRARSRRSRATSSPPPTACPSAGDVVGDDAPAVRAPAHGPTCSSRFRRAAAASSADDPAARLAALERDEPASHAALLSVVVFGYYTDADVRERLGYPGQQAKQLYSWKVPDYIEEGLTDTGPRARRRLARPGDGTAGGRDLRRRTTYRHRDDHGHERDGDDMTAPTATSWLEPFLDAWRPGTGEPRSRTASRPPGASLLTIPGSTPEDVARAAAAAAAAQPAWAATSYLERARILRRAAEIYEAHRAEFGTWTQRETGAVHGKMHHEQNFTVNELLNAATMPSQPYGSLVPTVSERAPLDGPPRARSGSSARSRRGTRRASSGMRVVGPALALGNAVVLKPDPQTPVAGGAMFAAVFAEAGPARGAAPGGRRRGRRRRGDRDRPQRHAGLVHGVDGRGTARRHARGRPAQEGLARARRQQRVRRARRRRPRGRGVGRARTPRSSSRARSASPPAGTSSTGQRRGRLRRRARREGPSDPPR